MIELLTTAAWIIACGVWALAFDWGFFGTSSHLVEGWVNNVEYKETLGRRMLVTFAGAVLCGIGFSQDVAWFRGIGASLIIASTFYALYLVWKGKPD